MNAKKVTSGEEKLLTDVFVITFNSGHNSMTLIERCIDQLAPSVIRGVALTFNVA